MGLAKAVEGSRYRGQEITWKDPDGTVADLTGATITARIRRYDGDTPEDSDGVFSLVDAANGVFNWAYGTTDVSEDGEFEVQFVATVGGLEDRTFIESFHVTEAL